MNQFTRICNFLLAFLITTTMVVGQNDELILPSKKKVTERSVLSEALSAGLAPAGHPYVCTPVKNGLKLPSDIAYADNAYSGTGTLPVGPIHFVLNDPSSAVSISSYTGIDFISGGTWKDGVWYGATYSSTGSQFITINTVTGARTTIGPMGVIVTDLAYDWTTGIMFAMTYSSASSKSYLYTVDISTGATTQVGSCGSVLLMGLACDGSGVLYTVSLSTDQLLTVNKTNGATTIVGPIGFNANYAQNIEFDNSDNTLYYAAYHTDDGGQLRTIDRTTGATTLIGSFPGGMEVTGFAIPNQAFNSLDHDVRINSIVSPVSGPFLSSTEPLTVTLQNVGWSPESNFPVSYRVNGLPPVTEIFTQTLTPDESATYSFSNTVDLSSHGTLYNMVVYTGLCSDQDHNNDTLSATIQNTNGIYCTAVSDTCEEYISNVNLLTLNNASNCSPGGYSDYSGMSVPMTIGQNVTISVTIGSSFSGDQLGIWIDWDHNFAFSSNELIMVTGGPSIFTSNFTVPGYAYPGDVRMRIRLSYGTIPDPCGTTQYGETEDYTISINGAQILDDIGVVELVSPVSGIGLPINAQVKARIINAGLITHSNIPISYIFNNGAPVNEVVTGLLAAGDTLTFTFSGTVNVSATGVHHIKVYTSLATDQVPANDTISGIVECYSGGTLIYDNGPLMNSPGTGYGGADESVLQGNLGMTTFGFGHAISSGYRVAEEFTIPEQDTWTITSISFYAYQTGSGITSTINNVNFRIWNGEPGTGSLIFGDNTTNRLSSSLFSGIYRISDGNYGNSNRPVMVDKCNIPALTLGSGTYWIDWQTGGTGSSGPWIPPITINGQTTTGNAIQFNGTTWGVLTDGGLITPQGLPFRLYGYTTSGNMDLGVTEIISPVTGPFLSSNELVTIKVKNFGSLAVSSIPVSYRLNNGPGITETINSLLLPNESITYTFFHTLDLSALGTYYLTVFSGLDNDMHHQNDTMNKTVAHMSVLYSINESFEEDFPPGGWTQISPIGGTGWNQQLVGTTPIPNWGGGVVTPTPDGQGGTKMAFVTYTDGGANANDQWLVTPYVHLSSGYKLMFWTRKFGNFADTLLVKISVSDPSIPSFTNTLISLGWTSSTADTGWVYHTYNLDSFAGQNLYFAFQEKVSDNTDFGAAIFLDLVKVGFPAISGCSGLQGVLSYNNSLSTPLTNTTVFLKQSNEIVSQVVTDSTGFYEFSGLNSGNYQLTGTSTKSWNGVNANDALKVIQHFAGMFYLTGLRKTAANVDASGSANAADALMIARRFVGMITSFPAGDWLFSTDTVQLTGDTTITHDFQGLCFGDVDGSNVPQAKLEPSVSLKAEGQLYAENIGLVEIPVYINKPAEVASASLVFTLDPALSEVQNVEFSQEGNLVYHQVGNELRMAWYSLIPMQLESGDRLLSLFVKTDPSLINNGIEEQTFLFLENESQLTDNLAISLDDIQLEYPALFIGDGNFYLGQNQPNPFNHQTVIPFILPVEGRVCLKVMDLLGREVLTLVDEDRHAGSYQVEIPGNILGKGLYTYRLELRGERFYGCLVKKMVCRE
ncbi:MAG: choice-of-anchor J domain-containing protein [Bacteroidetes bacterium]|nr:choice-of-anchor J domain-containing protein [Bacteroidota bacterium]